MGEKLINPKYNVYKKYRQMNLVNPYRFEPPPNTFIGGVSATINTPGLVASKLGISVTRIKSFKIVGSNIQFAVTSGTYIIPASSFSANTSITYYNDSLGLATQINTTAFKNCTVLTSVVFPNVTTIVSSTNAGIGGNFQGCTSLTTVNIPNFTHDATAKDYMFLGCTALTSLNFPLYSGNIGTNMFTSCTSLTSIVVNINGSVGANSYQGTKITSIDLTNATSIGLAAFAGITTLTGNVSAPLITSLPNQVFFNTRITSITANNCLSIGSGVFQSCTSLVTVNFTSVTTITSGAYASNGATFYNCTSLTTVNIPNFTYNATAKDYMFMNCTSLTTLNFPLYSGSIGINMFLTCTSLTSLTIGINGSVGANSYQGTKITSIDLTNATSIGLGAFAGVTTLTGNINMPVCTSIDSRSFSSTGITSITANNCTLINSGAFFNCASLASVSSTSVTSITSGTTASGNATFSGCILLTSLSFPALTSCTGVSTFNNCSNLASLSMPLLTSLGNSVSVLNNTFSGVKSGISITVPVAMQTINSGTPHVDISWSVSNVAAVITYV
jgi:hypothetical protein